MELIDLVNSVIISNHLTQTVNFPALLDLFFSWRQYLFYNGFSSIGKFWSCSCLSFHWLSVKLKQDAKFHRIAYYNSRADWDGLRDHLRDVPWDDIFKFSASATASKFCDRFQVEIDVYIPHCKYWVKPHSSPWFSAACAAAIVNRNHFFSLYQHSKTFESKVCSYRLLIVPKRSLNLLNLHLLIKQKSPSLSRN